MMAIMQEGNSEVPKEFLETGRTGRRNAMPDILQPQGAEVSTADLPNRLQQLVTSDAVEVTAGPSSADLEVQKTQEPRPSQADS